MKRHYVFTCALLSSIIIFGTSPLQAAWYNNAPIQQSKVQLLPLSEAEKASVLLMREEEKLAHDVYQAMYEKWGLAIFSNISRSEAQHMNAMKILIDRYGLNDPAHTQRGVFTNPTMQNLYDQLVTKGSRSVEDALLVGAEIEDLDIYDLERLSKVATQPDIKNTYAQLNKGSRNHLRSFVRWLAQRNIRYIPQYISAEYYQSIISSAMERGGMRRM